MEIEKEEKYKDKLYSNTFSLQSTFFGVLFCASIQLRSGVKEEDPYIIPR